MRIDRLTGGYPGRFLLRDLSFTVQEGQMAALLGLNGSGKTTIIKLICGLLKAKSGNVLIDEKDILRMGEKARARLISYVPQFCSIVHDIPVLDVVLMGISPYLKEFQAPARKHVIQAYECLEILGIQDLADSSYLTLSGGQKQMVLIARALLQNGRYLILDEPDSNLDLINKNKFMKQIRHITDTYRKGCLISMHNPEYALNYCDKIILVKDGTISLINLKKEEIKTIEKKLSTVYGPVSILQYREKYLLYHD